jgi:hypothetical protein
MVDWMIHLGTKALIQLIAVAKGHYSLAATSD